MSEPFGKREPFTLFVEERAVVEAAERWAEAMVSGTEDQRTHEAGALLSRVMLLQMKRKGAASLPAKPRNHDCPSPEGEPCRCNWYP